MLVETKLAEVMRADGEGWFVELLQQYEDPAKIFTKLMSAAICLLPEVTRDAYGMSCLKKMSFEFSKELGRLTGEAHDANN